MSLTAPISPAEHGRRRDRAVRLTVAAGAVAKAFSIACTLAQVPLVLGAFGTDGYGLWITLVSILVLLNLVDFGLGVGTQQVMAEAFGKDDPRLVRAAFFSGLIAVGILGLAVLAVGLPMAFLMNWPDLLNVQDPALRDQVRPALVITLVAFALGLPLNVAPRLAAATQRGWIQAGWIAAGSLATLVLAALASRGKWDFLTFALATSLVPLAQGAGLVAHLWKTLGWYGHDREALPRGEHRRLLRTSFLFAAPQAGLAVLQAAPPIVLAMASGPLAVTVFNLLQRLFSPVAQGQVLVLTPLWPAYAEAHTRGDVAWVRQAYRKSLLVGACCIAALGLLAWQSPLLLRWWLGSSPIVSADSFVWIAWLWAALQVAWMPPLYLLVATDGLNVLARWGTLGPVAALVAMALAAWLGVSAAGVIASGCAGLLLLGLPGLMRGAGRLLPVPMEPLSK